MDNSTFVQEKLGLKLDDALSVYLSEFPFSNEMFVCRYGLVHPLSRLVQVTEELRLHGFFTHEWPHRYLSIGRDDLGNEFFVDTEIQSSPVFIADHESSSISEQIVFKQAEDSVENWVKVMLKTEHETPLWIKEQFDG